MVDMHELKRPLNKRQGTSTLYSHIGTNRFLIYDFIGCQ